MTDDDFTVVVGGDGTKVATSRPVTPPRPSYQVDPVVFHYDFEVIIHPYNREMVALQAIQQVVLPQELTAHERRRLSSWFAGWLKEHDDKDGL